MKAIAPIHPFPARMAPELATAGLGKRTRHKLAVLDPMCGSGTALVEAARAGHSAFGVDSDPLAVLLTTYALGPAKAQSLVSTGDYVLDQAVQASGWARLTWPDQATREFVDFWFDEEAALQLEALSVSIGRVEDPQVRMGLWCAFSRMIIVKAGGVSRAMDLSHSRPHRKYETGPSRPFERFSREVDLVAARGQRSLPDDVSSANTVMRGDARALAFEASSFNRVITSPPYLNAIDYLRTSKFTLVWMGYSVLGIREVRATSVGTEAGSGTVLRPGVPWSRFGDVNGLEPRFASMVARYVLDLEAVMAEVGRVLKRGGRFTVVIGNSALRGVYIENAEAAVWALERAGLLVSEQSKREIPDNRRYMPPPSRASGITARMREEVVISGSKP